MLRDYFPTTRLSLKLMALLSLGLANSCPCLMRRPDVYEAAISGAYCFWWLGLVCFYLSMRRGHSLPWLMAASLAFGAAMCTRFTYVLPVAVFVLGLVWNCGRQ